MTQYKTLSIRDNKFIYKTPKGSSPALLGVNFIAGGKQGNMSIVNWENYGNYYKIFIKRKRSNEIVETLISSEDFELLSDYQWNANFYSRNKTYYIATSWKEQGKTKILYLHNLINKPTEGFVTDHINGNTLDNRRYNLRECTFSENSLNRRKSCYKPRKLTLAQVTEILDSSISNKELAIKFNVTPDLIGKTRRGQVKYLQIA